MSCRPNPPLLAYGWSDRWDDRLAGHVTAGLVPARVLRHDGAAALVATGEGETQLHLRRGTEVAVGDWVLADDDLVHDIIERDSLLQRRDPSTGDAQLIAANVDLVGIVCGLDRPVRPGRLQRFVTLAWDAGSTPLIVLTKSDLLTTVDEAVQIAEEASPGVDVMVVSAETRAGIDQLEDRLRGPTATFVGESGAGKSRLLNALADREVTPTGSVRSGDRKGRHTTTARQLHLIDGEYCVIDTPGVREVGLWAAADSVDGVFEDVAELARRCRFRDCRHDSEPGCSVREAVEKGELSPERIESWRRLRKEAEAAEIRADEHARRDAERRFGRVVREAKNLKRRSSPP
ncbi:MAG: ribosome small subunit-dependent GTPase A [Miltoncostaeaceae bacterium]